MRYKNTPLSVLLIRLCACICLLGSAAAMTAVAVCGAGVPDTLYRAAGTEVSFSDTLLHLENETAAVSSSAGGSGELYCGPIPVKTVRVVPVDGSEVVVCGTPFGLRLQTSGILVVGFTPVMTANGEAEPAKSAGLRAGDAIISADGRTLATAEQLVKLAENCAGKTIKLGVRRGGREFSVTVRPAQNTEGAWRLGIWVRDSAIGVGTLTFCDPKTGYYGGLGHGVCDSESGELMPVACGEISDAKITGVEKGRAGSPGELSGTVGLNSLGSLEENSRVGVFGKYYGEPEGIKLPVAMRQEVGTGKATIICTLGDDGLQEYSVVIEKLNLSDSENKNMVIRVTDPKLLARTGGIVQGMSGSPVIQNGKLVGAITHVLVSDPTGGYAIFADTMLAEAERLCEASGLEKAS